MLDTWTKLNDLLRAGYPFWEEHKARKKPNLKDHKSPEDFFDESSS